VTAPSTVSPTVVYVKQCVWCLGRYETTDPKSLLCKEHQKRF
jgi:hypothetical protein